MAGIARQWLARTALAGLLITTGCFFSDEIGLAEREVTSFHQQLNADEDELDETYRTSTAEFQARTSLSQWRDLTSQIRNKLGRFTEAEQLEQHVVQAGSVSTIELIYASKFTTGAATEDFTYTVQGGVARLRGYRISSAVLTH